MLGSTIHAGRCAAGTLASPLARRRPLGLAGALTGGLAAAPALARLVTLGLPGGNGGRRISSAYPGKGARLHRGDARRADPAILDHPATPRAPT